MSSRFTLAPGYHPSLPAAEYHRFRAASASALNAIHAGTPAHLKREWDEPQDPTPAMQWGTALHWAVLEPHAPSPVAVTPETYTIPDDAKPKKDGPKPGESVPWNPLAGPCKDWAALQRAAGKIIMRPDEYARLLNSALAVSQHPEAGPMLRRHAHHREATIVWEDARQVPCKARIDAHGIAGECCPLIVDLKTTTDASPAGFARKAWELGYHLQAAWYVDALATCTVDAPRFFFVAVEKDSGLVSVHQATDAFLAAGRDAYRKALDQFAEAWHTGIWPGYDENIHALDVPAWARKGGA